MDIAVEAAWTPMLAAFLASLVEFVEALTVVLAVGTVRGWRPALTGTGLAFAVLLALVSVLGPALTHIPLDLVQLVVGTLLLLFGIFGGRTLLLFLLFALFLSRLVLLSLARLFLRFAVLGVLFLGVPFLFRLL